MKLVCRHRNAGVCSTSTTAATSASGVSSCTSVSTGTPNWRAHVLEDLAGPASMPGPRKLPREERLALSKEALKTNGMPSRAVISLQLCRRLPRPASALSMTHGPGDQEERLLAADSSGEFMSEPARASCPGRLRQLRGPVRARGADEAGEQRMAVARRGGELRVELGGDEPRVARQLDDLHQPVAREAREAQARRARKRSR